MTDRKFKTIGIIGGMGPQATADLYQEILRNTEAEQDADHIPVLIYSLPQIPNRPKAILEGGESPVPMIAHAAKTLKKAGADTIIMACNTAHYYQEDIEKKAKVKILSMIDSTLEFIKNSYPEIKEVGLLATTGAVKTKIFEKDSELNIILPSDELQKIVADVIVDIKAGNITLANKDKLVKVINYLKNKGAKAIILGCTELPLILRPIDSELPLINTTHIAALKAIEFSQNDLQKENFKENILSKILYSLNVASAQK